MTDNISPRRAVLTARKPGIEQLLGSLPIEVEADQRDELRRWTNSLTADASSWQVERAVERNALARMARERR